MQHLPCTEHLYWVTINGCFKATSTTARLVTQHRNSYLMTYSLFTCWWKHWCCALEFFQLSLSFSLFLLTRAQQPWRLHRLSLVHRKPDDKQFVAEIPAWNKLWSGPLTYRCESRDASNKVDIHYKISATKHYDMLRFFIWHISTFKMKDDFETMVGVSSPHQKYLWSTSCRKNGSEENK